MNFNHDVDEGPLVVHLNPGKLTDLATVSLAAALMHHKILNWRRIREKPFYISEVGLDEILLPSSIKSTIRELVECNMIEARTQWWAYHRGCVFLQNFPADTMIDWLDQLVWLPGGTINYRQTAKKLLNCGKLTNVQKLQLACSYCFVEDVEVLKETLTNAEINDAVAGYHVSEYLIPRYWHNRLQLGPFVNLYVNNRIMLLNRVISSLKYYDEWSAVEYFFNQLDNEARLRKLNDFIDLDKPKITWHLLLSLTGPELDSAIRGKSRQIMKTLVKEHRYFEYSVLVWKRMVHLIDDDALADIIIQVNDRNDKRDYLNSLLWEMWLDTLERQKKFIADEEICDFIENLENDEYNTFNTPNYPLIIDMLSRSSPERRYKYLTQHYPYLILGQLHQKKFIDQIMKLCIGNDEQIENFKSSVMIEYGPISEDCEYLMSYGMFDEVSNYVDFCSTNQQVNQDLKKMIITKMPVKKLFDVLFHYWNVETNARLNRYLNEIFTEHESKEFLNGIVTHPKILKKLCRELNSRFGTVIKFVERFVSSEENLVKVKHDLFHNYRLEKNFSDSVYLDLIVWCFNGDKSIANKFKKLLPRDREVSDVEMAPDLKNPIFETFMEFYHSDSENN